MKKESQCNRSSSKKANRRTGKNAALKEVPGKWIISEAKNVNGISYYLVEIEANDGREATVEINAITGKINTLTRG